MQARKLTHQQTMFIAGCKAWGLPEPEPEFRFMPSRKWRLDYAFLLHRIGVEIQGGLFVGGRHVRGAALIREYEKLNALAILGWRTLMVTPQQVKSGEVFALVKEAMKS